ncbi:MAG TPA: hypothetical protein VFZ59_26415 [Verrucomicrobiae bacterium]|nr:hypothetical protein [Verrucomicrobiae bacterium]
MRRLAQPSVLKSAGVAALLTSIICYPRFAQWQNDYAIWYAEAVMFLGSLVLWAFVFAWHTEHSGRPVFNHCVDWRLWVAATAAGVLVATVLHVFLDPTFKLRTPADYPTSVEEWLAKTAFAVAFYPLFLTFAPFAWAARLSHRVWIAAVFTVLFGVFVMTMKIQSAPTPLPPGVFLQLLALRLVLGTCSVYFYLRGGAGLVWWWVLLLQLRHLLDF